MAKYKGKTARVEAGANRITEKFSDLSVLESHLANIPDDQRDKIGNISFEPDAIILTNPSIGEMRFKRVENTPEKIVFSADGMVPLSVVIALDSVDENTTDVTTTLDIEIPVMLRPLIGSKLQSVADIFGDLIAKLASDKPIELV